MNSKVSKPFVSICIPTRNRCEYLKNNILSIVKQKPYKEGLVEIIVVDNASTDNTQDTIKILSKEYDIVYNRNELDIGSEANYRIAIGMASGKLIKLINDSIVFLDNSLEKIIEIVRRYSETRPQVYFSNRDKDELLLLDFRNFVFAETYKITALSTLSLWSEDRDLVISDTSCDENRLWCTNSCLKLSKHNKNVLLVNMRLFKGQKLEVKYFDYPLFNVFYIEFFNLLHKYLVFNDDRRNEKFYGHIERELLFNFFLHWVYNYDNRNESYSKYKFLNDENLHDKVFKCCKEKPYYIIWFIKYYLYTLRMRLRNGIMKDKV